MWRLDADKCADRVRLNGEQCAKTVPSMCEIGGENPVSRAPDGSRDRSNGQTRPITFVRVSNPLSPAFPVMHPRRRLSCDCHRPATVPRFGLPGGHREIDAAHPYCRVSRQVPSLTAITIGRARLTTRIPGCGDQMRKWSAAMQID